MALIIRVNHKEEQPQPWADKPALDLAERLATREYIMRHPFFPVLLRARQADGRGRNNYYNPHGDIQLRRVDGNWPMRWIEDVDLAGQIHDLGFDADPAFPRGPDAYDVFKRRLYRALARLGLYDEGLL